MPVLSKSAALLAGVFSLAAATPLDLSIPGGLIPAIPGVTEPLGDIVPPLPILQAPLPALPSPPFSGSDIKPKKIGYFWTGSGDDQHKDFLATVSLDDVSRDVNTLVNRYFGSTVANISKDTFGTIIEITDVPTSGNSPHHLSPSADGKTLLGGGLLSILKTQDTAFYFDVSNPYSPQFLKSNRAILSSVVDEIRAKPDG